MRRTTFRDLDAAVGGRIVNRTNGITFRRWLHQTNPGLTKLLVETLGRARAARPGRADRAWCRMPRMPGSATPSAPSAARASSPWPALAAAQLGVTDRPGRAVRRADQAHPRVQAPVAERAAGYQRSTTRSAPSRRAGPAAAGEDLRRQGRARPTPFAKQIIRLAMTWRAWSTATRRCAACCRSCSCRTTT